MSDERTAVITGPQQGIVRAHQPGNAVSKSTLSKNIKGKPFSAFPPAVRLAVIVGEPLEPGPYTIRVRVPHGVKLMPHRDRKRTRLNSSHLVISYAVFC